MAQIWLYERAVSPVVVRAPWLQLQTVATCLDYVIFHRYLHVCYVIVLLTSANG